MEGGLGLVTALMLLVLALLERCDTCWRLKVDPLGPRENPGARIRDVVGVLGVGVWAVGPRMLKQELLMTGVDPLLSRRCVRLFGVDGVLPVFSVGT